MCDICRGYPCFSGCPNELEPKHSHICDKCGEKIYIGDKYTYIFGEYIHEECLTIEMLLDFLNVEIAEAE